MVNWDEVFYGQVKYCKNTPYTALFEMLMMKIFYETKKSMGWFYQEEDNIHITYHYCEFGNFKFVQHRIKLLKQL